MELVANINKAIVLGGETVTLLSVHKTQYHDGNVAIIGRVLYPDGLQEDICLSVNIPQKSANLMRKGEFFLKNWSEHEGMLESLDEAGVILDTCAYVFCGYVSAPIVCLACGDYYGHRCDECENPFDDNPGETICKTCEDWIAECDPSPATDIVMLK